MILSLMIFVNSPTWLRLRFSVYYHSPNRSQAAMNFRTGTKRGQPCPRVPYHRQIIKAKLGHKAVGSLPVLLAKISED
jgi:hypothetical protein